MLKNKENILTILAVIVLLAILGVYLLFDIIAATSLFLGFTAVFGAMALVLALIIVRSHPLSRKAIFIAGLMLLMLSLRFVNWDSRKPFLRDFNQIQPGMTAAQVDEIMSGYMRSTSLETTENEVGEIQSGYVSFRHTNEGWGDADIGQIAFENGQVVSSVFFPD